MKNDFKEKRNNLGSLFVVALFCALFLYFIFIPGSNKPQPLLYHLKLAAIAFALIFIPAIAVYFNGRQKNIGYLNEAKKWYESNKNAVMPSGKLEFETGYKEYYEANHVTYLRVPMMYVVNIFWYYMALAQGMLLSYRDGDFSAWVLFILAVFFCTYPYLGSRYYVRYLYNKQKNVFGKQELEISDDFYKEKNQSQEIVLKELYDIQISKEYVLIFPDMKKLVMIPKKAFASEEQYYFWVMKAYNLVKK